MRKLTLEEWLAEGEKRFGKDYKKWKFVCPACGRVSSVKEFMKLGADPNDAYQNCVGRVNGKGKGFLKGEKSDTFEDGCDWASYGLFGNMGKGPIVLNNGKETQAFEFAE